MKMIELKNLTKYYGSFKALDGINLTVNKGEVLGFIGPNGAGKTTTIRILLGLLRKSEGQAMIMHKDCWHDSVEIHKHIAYVPGDVHLWPNLTGGEVIDFFTALSGGNNKEKKERLIRLFDLDPTKKCGTYSKGNRQKVGLIAAFASNAEVIILDEPTSGLDPLMTSIFQNCVMNLKKEGKTVLMSSHILADVEKLCDRVTIIRKGKIVQTGKISELRHRTHTLITVETNEEIMDLALQKGISHIEQDKHMSSFLIEQTHMSDIMQHISKFGVRQITSTPPTLEEIFMKHYGQDLSDNI